MHKFKQDFFFLILKQNILIFYPDVYYDVVAVLRHLPLYDVILFPAAQLRYVEKKPRNL